MDNGTRATGFDPRYLPIALIVPAGMAGGPVGGGVYRLLRGTSAELRVALELIGLIGAVVCGLRAYRTLRQGRVWSAAGWWVR